MALVERTYIGLCRYAEARGWRVRLALDDARPARPSRLSVHDREGEELEYVALGTKKTTTLDEAATVLFEFLDRTTTPED